MFHFAAVCLADQDISAMVEDSQARAVASIENDLSMAERLLVASDCEYVACPVYSESNFTLSSKGCFEIFETHSS
jgi:hypothetical protein